MDGLCKRNEQMSIKRDRKMQCLFHRVKIFISLDLAAFCSNVIHNEAFNLQKMVVVVLWVTKAMYVSKPPDYISWQLDELLWYDSVFTSVGIQLRG